MDLLGRVGRAASIAIPLAVGIAAFALRLRTALADFETYDERTWAMLSRTFGRELLGEVHIRGIPYLRIYGPRSGR